MLAFSKVDKEVLIILIAVLVLALLLGFVIYKNMNGSSLKVKNSAGGVQIEQSLEINH